jgi:hypothetical protein
MASRVRATISLARLDDEATTHDANPRVPVVQRDQRLEARGVEILQEEPGVAALDDACIRGAGRRVAAKPEVARALPEETSRKRTNAPFDTSWRSIRNEGSDTR